MSVFITDYAFFEFNDHLPIIISSLLSLELPYHNNYCLVYYLLCTIVGAWQTSHLTMNEPIVVITFLSTFTHEEPEAQRSKVFGQGNTVSKLQGTNSNPGVSSKSSCQPTFLPMYAR